MINGLTSLLALLNFFPSLKTKVGALAAFGLAIVAAWNSFAPAIGLGPCVGSALPTVVGAVVAACTTDWTLHIPDAVSAAVMALIGIGAANAPMNRLVADQAVAETKTLVIPTKSTV